MTIWGYLQRRWGTVLELTIEHIVLVAVSVTIAVVTGVFLGTLVYRNNRATALLLNVTNGLFTVPALAYFTVLVALVGLGWAPSIIVLAIYALLPIVRNTVTGLREVNPAIVKAATGMGMGRIQLVTRIHLPLAWPVILAGIRVGAVLTVGIAAVAAYISGPGLGREIFGGLAALRSARAVPQAVVGTVGIIFVALLIDAFLVLVGKLTTAKEIR
ncbi:MAG: ABC transporter permease [Actinobacteria bacterium]|nr:ABC transporter permease [Actinomycetota bacterium]